MNTLSAATLTYIAKNDAILCRGDLYIGLNVAEIMWCQHHRMRALNQFKVTQCGQLQCAVLQRVIWEKQEEEQEVKYAYLANEVGVGGG